MCACGTQREVIAGDGEDPVVTKLARLQDKIGWRQFMEGVIYLSVEKWARGLFIAAGRQGCLVGMEGRAQDM